MARPTLSYGDYRPLRKGELGYSKTARRYVSDTTGRIISVREFQKHATRTSPPPKTVPGTAAPTSVGAIQVASTRAGKTRYKEFITIYQRNANIERAKQGLPPLTRRDVIRNSEFKAAYKIIARGKKDKSPNGPLASALVTMGLRKPEWQFPVGESPH